jgi:uncharacterized protein YkwD
MEIIMINRCIRAFSVLAVICSIGLCPTGTADTKGKSTFEISDDEQAILDLTNKARKKEKLPPLKASEALFKVARAHSANMAKQGKMEHVLDNKNPAQRVKAGGYRYSYVGENVAAGNGWSLEDVFQVWMDSETHKKNILAREFREIGIGIARDDGTKLYYTQVFASPRRAR